MNLEGLSTLLLGILTLLGFIWRQMKLYYKKHKPRCYQLAYDLVATAETLFGSGTGKLKYSYVVEAFYHRLPRLLRVVITKKEANRLIEEAVAALKRDLLEQAQGQEPPEAAMKAPRKHHEAKN